MLRGLFFVLLSALLGMPALAALNVTTQTALNAATASADHYSYYTSPTADPYSAQAPFYLPLATSASYQITWTGLTGTLDATVTIQASNDCTSTWVNIPGAALVISSASGSDFIGINGTVSEYCHRVFYDHNNVAAGTVTVKGVGK